MNPNIKLMACATLVAVGFSSCLDETFPTSSITADQLTSDLPGLSNGISAYMNTFGSSDYSDVGWMARFLWLDSSVGNIPTRTNAYAYDYFNWYNIQEYIGDGAVSTLLWRRPYYLIQKCNAVLSAGADVTPEHADAPYIGNALAYRAMAYMDLAFSCEFFATGTSLDQTAETSGLYGITVPIVTENTSEEKARDNERAPFYTLYRFVNDDLARAEQYLANTVTAESGNNANLGFAYAEHARLWLTIATRFRLAPEDLQTAIANDGKGDYKPLGVASARDAYAKAAEYARKAINLGYAPMSYNQWFDPKTGFNTINQSWLLSIIITTDMSLANQDWKSFVSFTSPEASWGVATSEYGAYRMIDARLWDKIQPGDWRAMTWIAPGDEGDITAFNEKYSDKTNAKFSEWSKWSAYAGNKVHPNQGNTTTQRTGNAISMPLMRIEECFFIEAEAVAYTQGFAAGKELLEKFMNTYRMTGNTGYTCPADEDGFMEELIAQKRIEFWLEGVTYFDFRRLKLPVIKAYPGTNHPKNYQFNSYPDFVAPWTTFFIPVSECNLNTACKRNPNASDIIPEGEQYEPIV